MVTPRPIAAALHYIHRAEASRSHRQRSHDRVSIGIGGGQLHGQWKLNERVWNVCIALRRLKSHFVLQGWSRVRFGLSFHEKPLRSIPHIPDVVSWTSVRNVKHIDVEYLLLSSLQPINVPAGRRIMHAHNCLPMNFRFWKLNHHCRIN